MMVSLDNAFISIKSNKAYNSFGFHGFLSSRDWKKSDIYLLLIEIQQSGGGIGQMVNKYFVY